MSNKAVPGYAENGGSKYVMNQKANGTYERKKISFDSDAIESLEANALPKVSSHDNGKVLGVKSGKWQKMDAPSGLPTVSGSDEGKVLTVDSSGDWGAANIPSQLPTVTSSDEGKVLAVNSSGAWAAATPSGGSFVVNVIWDDNTGGVAVNKTWREIKNAAETGKPLCFISSYDEDGETGTNIYTVNYIYSDLDGYYLQLIQFYYENGGATNISYILTASTENGYPAYTPIGD